MKKIILIALGLVLLGSSGFCADSNDEKQIIKVKNTYLSLVVADKESINTQEITINNSFLVFIKIKAGEKREYK